MPVYEYVCQSCQHRFEAKQKMSDAPLTSCPRCGQPVSKVISAPAIMFKGSGWYVTDYSDKLKQPGETKPAEKPKDGNGGQPESKPAGTSPAPASGGTSGSASGSSTGTNSGGTAPSGSSTPPASSTPAASS